ncbi:hypothetical protein [Nocardioides sp. URHA0032]|uniref:hypothetical protein n=1 Tax=Nocardioides sp. URHA0032 TaxID=1380388 RepID=UPI00048D013C|nr:hypothetical protein [Nocardioides sp. URHA0032]
MTSWFRRARSPEPTERDPDTPEVLAADLVELIRMINRNAGRLPVGAVVAARGVTDVVREILDCLSDDDVPDIQAILSVRGIVRDYLPTTLRGFLALDLATAEASLSTSHDPRAQIREQLDNLWSAATDVLVATRARDADKLVTQGNFLRTKFTRSDLDL